MPVEYNKYGGMIYGYENREMPELQERTDAFACDGWCKPDKELP